MQDVKSELIQKTNLQVFCFDSPSAGCTMILEQSRRQTGTPALWRVKHSLKNLAKKTLALFVLDVLSLQIFILGRGVGVDGCQLHIVRGLEGAGIKESTQKRKIRPSFRAEKTTPRAAAGLSLKIDVYTLQAQD